MKPTTNSFLSLVFLQLLAVATITISFCNGSTYVGFIQSERDALLRFKHDLNDSSNQLSTWVGDGDCCKWDGVVCSNFTGHVLELHLGTPSSSNQYYSSYADYRRSKLRGNLPVSIGNLSALLSLDLRRNSFSGGVLPSLKNCTKLVALDIGENEFSGNIPTWMGERFRKLVILNFRSNKFHGLLPTEFCHLTSLQIIDLAYNNLSGSIPRCINNFSAMVATDYSQGNSIQFLFNLLGEFSEDALLVMKGTTVKYDSTLNLVRSIDLSKNNFSGEIPMEVTSLHALRSLNLSHNFLRGRIPETIGDMTNIEAIDLSANLLLGKIPQSIASLTFLNHLNLSNNKLTGRIPLGTQLQSFDALSFIGNELCGSPLKNCTVATVPTPEHENGEHEVEWFYVSMALGFVVGFWSLIGPLLINRRWRYKYYCFLDRVWNKFVCIVRKCL
ncbi:hypothetical protein Ddye_027401 [Dipteronia dyeriana]|uniref:Leucine-rich repeat-containing N-terminal plant-type domain-containing protein n=1 Tax=Dipteronia dyeriana TaxID=168575 RepID=A0AAD9TPP0_9ROSI|nr:hypothetical protein Ddye_027401 [Dipteronia dyeriana]